MSELHCPQCGCDYCYQDGELNICPECAFEWRDGETTTGDDTPAVLDANGVALADGDSVVLSRRSSRKAAAKPSNRAHK